MRPGSETGLDRPAEAAGAGVTGHASAAAGGGTGCWGPGGTGCWGPGGRREAAREAGLSRRGTEGIAAWELRRSAWQFRR
jgi:hypothetical protein